jgi:hypothetical protein
MRVFGVLGFKVMPRVRRAVTDTEIIHFPPCAISKTLFADTSSYNFIQVKMAQSDFTSLSVHFEYEVADESMFDVGTEIQYTSISNQSSDPTQVGKASLEIFNQVNDVNDVLFTPPLANTSSLELPPITWSSMKAQNLPHRMFLSLFVF